MKVIYFSDLHLELIKPSLVNKFIEQIVSNKDEVFISREVPNMFTRCWVSPFGMQSFVDRRPSVIFSGSCC